MNESIQQARERRAAIAEAQAILNQRAAERRAAALAHFNRSRFSWRNVLLAGPRVAREVWRLRVRRG